MKIATKNKSCHDNNPSALEYQNAALDCIYYAGRQSCAAGGDTLDITG